MITVLKRRSGNSSRLMLTVAIWFFAMTCVFVALNQATFAAATYFKWDPSKTGTGSDGSGNWDTTSTLWTAGTSDTNWSSSSVASFGNGTGAAGTVTLQSAITTSGFSFSMAGSGDYTIAAAAPADTLSLVGTATVTVAPGTSPTISVPIAASAGLTVCGGGTLNISGTNTYINSTTILQGTLNVLAGGTLGNGSTELTLGNANTSSIGNLNLNMSASVTSVIVNTASTTADGINISPNQTLTVNGSLSVGGPLGSATGLKFTGGGNLIVNGSIFIGGGSQIGQLVNVATIDLSGLQSFNCSSSSGIFSVPSSGGQSQSTLTLANNNMITIGSILVGSFPNGTVSAASGAINLGAGSTTIDANSITVANNTPSGTIGWLSGTTTGSLSISGIGGGTTRSAITIGSSTGSNTGTNSAGSMLLDGHSINIQASTLTLGTNTSSISATVSGSLAFDTGTVDVTSINMSQASNIKATTSTLTLGSNSSSTGALIVNSASGPGGGFFSLANYTNSVVSPQGIFDIKGGAADVNCDITVNVKPNVGTFGASGTVLLEGGTLNMMGHNIGGAAALNNITLTAKSGTLENVASINGTGGLTMSGTGSLTIAGTNSWTGATTVSSGTLALGASTTLGDTAITIASNAILDLMAGSSAGNTTTAAAGAMLAGTTGGATFDLEDGTTGKFTLTQGTSFSGVALTLGGDTLDFDLNNLGADEILDSGPGKASVSGINIINLDALTPTLSAGTYTLISVPSGGLTGTFEFSNSQTSETLDGDTVFLTNSPTAETLTVVVPEPAGMAGLVLCATVILGRGRRVMLGRLV